MDTQTEFVRYLVRQMNSNAASSLFLNGAPGTGKTYLLNTLSAELPRHFVRSCVLGPYSLDADDKLKLGHRIANDVHELGFVDQPLLPESVPLTDAWMWLSEHGRFTSNQSIFVLVDLSAAWHDNLPALGDLFSSSRHLEGIWKDQEPRICHVFAGFWDHQRLESYYVNESRVSFPYTVGNNYAVWTGIEEKQMVGMVSRAHSSAGIEWRGRVLHELTGGHPGVVLEILHLLQVSDLSLGDLLIAARSAAETGSSARVLVDAWKRLPEEARSVLYALLLRRQLAAHTERSTIEQLKITGAVRVNRQGTTRYLSFYSWYVELVARCHASDLGIDDQRVANIRSEDLIPTISVLNNEAYRIINDIENTMRNFVTARLSLARVGVRHVLEGRGKRMNDETGMIEDAYQSACDWQKRSLKKGLVGNLNPLIAYCSTRDLVILMRDIANDAKSEPWHRIAHAMQNVSDLRDAVMHNQLIEFQELQRLLDLQTAIYEAISE